MSDSTPLPNDKRKLSGQSSAPEGAFMTPEELRQAEENRGAYEREAANTGGSIPAGYTQTGTPSSSVYDDQAGSGGGGPTDPNRFSSGKDITEKYRNDQRNRGDMGNGGSRGGGDFERGLGNKAATPEELGAAESQGNDMQNALGARGAQEYGDDQVGLGYNDEEEPSGSPTGRFLRRHKSKIAAGVISSALLGGSIAGFSAMGPFELKHIIENINGPTLGRLQGVDIADRSFAFQKAYMEARLFEVSEATSGRPVDNILFRADKLKYDKAGIPTFWSAYNKLRPNADQKLNDFETKLFEDHGVRLTSMFVQKGNIRVRRTAAITINDTPLSFDPTSGPDALPASVLDGALRGDPNSLRRIQGLTGKLDEFISTQLVGLNGTDKEARQVIRGLAKAEYPKVTQLAKRWFFRKDWRNVIGVRPWKFFEQTRQAFTEKKLSIRNAMINKMVTAMLPSSSRLGLFIKCVFGITCDASEDTSNGKNRAPAPDPNAKDDSKTGNPDNNGGTYGEGEGSGSDILAGAAEAPPENPAVLSDLQTKIANQLLGKLNFAAAILTIIDLAAHLDSAIHDGKFSKIIYAARMAAFAALFLTMTTANDQATVGDYPGDEMNNLMSTMSNATNNEAWSTIVDNKPAIVHADSITPATDKFDFCSVAHQAALQQNPSEADKEFNFWCDAYKVGGGIIKNIEDSWNNTLGLVLHPLLTLFKNTLGPFVDVYIQITTFMFNLFLQAGIKAAAAIPQIKDLASWLGAKLMSWAGAGPIYDGTQSNGELVESMFTGGAASAEIAARGNGGARTTPDTRIVATQRYIAFKNEQNKDMSISDRYISLNNTNSIASKVLFSIVNKPLSQYTSNIFGTIGSILSSPFNAISRTVNADNSADNPYLTADMAGVITYDFPKEACLDAPMLTMDPDTATNAVQMGIFKPGELTWDVVSDKDKWYDALYAKVGDDDDKAMKVWNCALLDNTVEGSVGQPYGYQAPGIYKN